MHNPKNCRPIGETSDDPKDPYKNSRTHGGVTLEKGKHWEYDTGDHDWYVFPDKPVTPVFVTVYGLTSQSVTVTALEATDEDEAAQEAAENAPQDEGIGILLTYKQIPALIKQLQEVMK